MVQVILEYDTRRQFRLGKVEQRSKKVLGDLERMEVILRHLELANEGHTNNQLKIVNTGYQLAWDQMHDFSNMGVRVKNLFTKHQDERLLNHSFKQRDYQMNYNKHFGIFWDKYDITDRPRPLVGKADL
mmetsp:Transcript_16354/g.27656  ORF Transcript_16354/g.27656 Transcript_16354/m.27656 type:complete len:129 (+) Transcript_16354:346-732(+)|eukprot:CAMPEP_0168625818 /NCGR_PEP_ID=MMETSP0449_2-20121227/10249_1 /TAXON_ID=1082188 /ORGANISM="Strombidium rassoulzadegani, Strain ras09" /LENGTH=128 /DNA_ID=CAMNT_0008667667 /DNA_START=327 /DNA_END=713 /DNA_ORIENTATION=+